MSDTAISPGVGSIAATGVAPGSIMSNVVSPITGAVEATGSSSILGFGVAVGVGSIEAVGSAPSGGMWNESSSSVTVWTVQP